MVDVIEAEFSKAGLSRYLAAAAVANSMKESKLDPSESFYGKNYKKTGKKTEDSVGLFMLNSMARGLGSDMPKGAQYPKGDSRYVPELNARRVIREIKNLKVAREAFALADANIPELAALFAKYIEKPGELDKSMHERRELAAEMFPTGIDGLFLPSSNAQGSSSLKETQPEPEAASTARKMVKWGLGLSVVALGVTAALRHRAKMKGEL
jgi:hypothetical protein